jgi:hypothetical protein
VIGGRRGRGRILVALAIAGTLVLTGCSGATDEKKVPVSVATRLEPPPSGCRGPVPARSQPPGTELGRMFGHAPVWAGPYATYEPSAQALHLGPDAPRARLGWRIKVLWALSPEIDEKVAVSGQEVTDGTPVSFALAEGAPTTSAILDPAAPGVPVITDEPLQFPSYAYFPRAGCYSLEARWNDGDWSMVFAVGR